jgi:hypothetical protein
MEKLDPRASCYQSFSVIPIGAAGEQQDQGSQPLPAGADEPKHEIGHTRIINLYDFFQPRLH